MSYSINVTAPTKEAAIEAVRERFAHIVSGVTPPAQPNHAHDQEAVIAATTAFVNLLPDDDTRDVRIGVGGGLGWKNGEDGKPFFESASIGVAVGYVPRRNLTVNAKGTAAEVIAALRSAVDPEPVAGLKRDLADYLEQHATEDGFISINIVGSVAAP